MRAKYFAGLSLDRPRIFGIINVTPDSFSDGGETFDINSIISHGSVAISAGWAGYESPILTPASLAALVQAGPHH